MLILSSLSFVVIFNCHCLVVYLGCCFRLLAFFVVFVVVVTSLLALSLGLHVVVSSFFGIVQSGFLLFNIIGSSLLPNLFKKRATGFVSELQTGVTVLKRKLVRGTFFR